VEEKELASSAKGQEIANARTLVSYIATRGLSISGSDVARRVDRSSVCRAVQRVKSGTALNATAARILKLLGQRVSQH